MQLYTSTPLPFRGKCCTFYFHYIYLTATVTRLIFYIQTYDQFIKHDALLQIKLPHSIESSYCTAQHKIMYV